jgi:hypothetical protein
MEENGMLSPVEEDENLSADQSMADQSDGELPRATG